MIKVEKIVINNKNFIKHYSDENKYILQVETGLKYSQAVDIENAPYTYVETDEVIEEIEGER